jgi:nitroimidazol reductase NimA-like FMN-containing flavoprotein (pyridoxamine 5'-phosphate oxidase superfamily)
VARSVRLSDDEAWALVEQAHTGVFTSLRRDGTPVSLPVWFVVLERHVYFSGPAHTKKLLRVHHDPRAAFLVESGERWAELMGVHLTGRARIVTDGELLARVAAALDATYATFRTPRAEMPEVTRANYEVETATVELTPDARVLSWDNSRLGLA